MITAAAVLIGLQLGSAHTTDLFEHSRYAFPDLAQGGPGCCQMTFTADNSAPAARLTVRKEWDDFGLEWSAAYLGKRNVAFDVSGPFGAPAPGRCVESGTFRFYGTALTAGWSANLGPVTIRPQVGVSGNWSEFDHNSRCDFQGAPPAHVEGNDKRFSMSPVVGLGVSVGMFRLDVERRTVTLSNNAESQQKSGGKVPVTAVWFGIEREF